MRKRHSRRRVSRGGLQHRANCMEGAFSDVGVGPMGGYWEVVNRARGNFTDWTPSGTPFIDHAGFSDVGYLLDPHGARYHLWPIGATVDQPFPPVPFDVSYGTGNAYTIVGAGVSIGWFAEARDAMSFPQSLQLDVSPIPEPGTLLLDGLESARCEPPTEMNGAGVNHTSTLPDAILWVPEPATIGLLAIAALSLRCRRA